MKFIFFTISLLLGNIVNAQFGNPLPEPRPGVGVGTNNPQAMLDVEGDVIIREADIDDPNLAFNALYRNPDGKIATSKVPGKIVNFEMLTPSSTDIGATMWNNNSNPVLNNQEVLIQQNTFTLGSDLEFITILLTFPLGTCYIPGIVDLRSTGTCQLITPSGTKPTRAQIYLKYRLEITAPDGSITSLGTIANIPVQKNPPQIYAVFAGGGGNLFKYVLPNPLPGNYTLKLYAFDRGVASTYDLSSIEFAMWPSFVTINTYKLL